MRYVLLIALLTWLSAPAFVPRRRDGMEAYRGNVADRIIDAALDDSAAFDRLAYLVDTFGPRFSGTQNLEDAIDWVLAEMAKDGLENVRGEPVMVPRWVRGRESLTLLAPHVRELQILGLGGSVATPPEGIEAEVLVVGSFDELRARAAEAVGKIVLYNVPFTTYGETVRYRTTGAVEAARTGAVASLVRSVGPFSLYTPHTGNARYEDGVPEIPHAAVTVEDAMMMQRMQDRGQTVRVRLYMEARTLDDVPSRNVVAELVGREHPEEVVVLGGHIDSWDVGQGAMDDAGGCVAAWEAVRLLKELGLRPRRTLRVVLWTNEENGLRGALAYRDAHSEEIENHVLAIESDAGVFKPTGFGFGGSDAAYEVVRAIGRLLDRIGAGAVTRGGGGADIGPLMRQGVPGMGLSVDGSKYFWYHHTNADTLDKLDPHEFNLAVATLAVMAYVVAEMPERLPRDVPAGR
ncbi:MAG: aminopeptidase [Rhodothermaceae bacterium]|nr:MAG: aminopeptidase [Rhodothermaceae bacterium]